MDNFRNLYERVNEEIDPEYALSEKLEQEIGDLINNLKDEFWFDENTLYHVDKVMDWLKEHSSDLYKEALKDPTTLEGRDEVGSALQNLGYMIPWVEMDVEEIQNPDDIERWRTAMGYYEKE